MKNNFSVDSYNLCLYGSNCETLSSLSGVISSGVSVTYQLQNEISYIKNYISFADDSVYDFLLNNQEFSKYLKTVIIELSQNNSFWMGELKLINDELSDKSKLLFVYSFANVYSSQVTCSNINRIKGNKLIYKRLIKNLFRQPNLVKSSLVVDEQSL